MMVLMVVVVVGVGVAMMVALVLAATIMVAMVMTAMTVVWTVDTCLNPPRRERSLELIFGQPLFLLIIVGGMFRYMGAFTLVTYLPDFYSQVYPEYNTICEKG